MSVRTRIASLLSQPLFWVGLIAKLALMPWVSSYYLSQLFIPFVNYFVESGFSDPWAHFGALGKTTNFPYPPLMLYVLAVPRLFFSPLLQSGIETVTHLHLFALRLPLLTADVLLLATLIRFSPKKQKTILWLYWLSPISFYVSYYLGQLDVLPTAVFFAALGEMHRKRFTRGGLALGLAVSLKFHLVLALPFLALLLMQERKKWASLRPTLAFVGTVMVLLFPFVLHDAFRNQVFGTPEAGRIFWLRIPLDSQAVILVAPLTLAALWFRMLAFQKRNWDVCMLFTGIAFSVMVLLSAPLPGYFYWSVPFLVYFVARTKQVSPVTFAVFSAAFVVCVIALPSFRGPVEPVWAGQAALPLEQLLSYLGLDVTARLGALAFTAIEAALLGTVYQMYRYGIKSNAIYGARNTPIGIGIAGDSGTGKDRLVYLIQRMLSSEDVCSVSGDNYHRWQRGDLNWQKHTHLNANANRLHLQYEDALELISGRSVRTEIYDHSNGTFTKKQLIEPGRYVVLSGLHAFLLENQRSLYDLRIYLEPDPLLHKHWKIQRDVQERGYSVKQVLKTISRRKPDGKRFVAPQRQGADIIFSLRPKDRSLLNGQTQTVPLFLEVHLRNTVNLQSLVEKLSAVGLAVQHEPFVDEQWQMVTLEGSISPTTLARIAGEVVPNLEDLCVEPSFDSDLSGCMQLLVLVSLSHQLRYGRRYSDRAVDPARNERRAGNE